MPLSLDERRHIQERISGFCREVGTLLVAFAPLDFAMQSGTIRTAVLVGFVVAGGSLFGVSLFIELRLKR